jgi:signal transduction histidine kinase
MFPDRLFRTSSFRLALISSLFFCLALLLLANFVATATMSMMVRQTDLTVQGEVAEIFNDANEGDLAHLTATITRTSATSPQFFYLLQDSGGTFLAGNLPNDEPVIGIHDWHGKLLRGDGEDHRIHGVGMRTVDGAYLFVGVRAYKTSKMYGALTRYFLWIMAFTFLALLFGGVFMSSRMLSRVEAISRTSRDIVSGDLQRRVPVRGTNDEFDHLALSLNVMLDRIQDLMEGLRQVSNDIAHDLRTPLTRLRHRLEHARGKASTVEELQDALDQSIIHVDSILSIFSGLLRIAQIEAGVRKSTFRKLDLAEVLSEVVGLYKPVFDEKKQNLLMDIFGALEISGDRELLTQLFVNILDNATNHIPPGCTVMVKGRVEGEHVCVEVADDGPGIPEELRDKIFERFYRLEQSRSTPGHGLGLSLVAAVAEQHEAWIELLDNKPGLLMRLTFKYCPRVVLLPQQMP